MELKSCLKIERQKMKKNEYETLRNQLKQNVLLMLGEPVHKVDLNKEEIDLCINEALSCFEGMTCVVILDEKFELDELGLKHINEAAIAFAKIIIGRKKVKSYNGDTVSGTRMYKEGTREIEEVRTSMMDYIPECEAACEVQPKTNEYENVSIRGLLVFYVNVGTLPIKKAELFVERMKQKIDLTRIKKICEVTFIPTRDQHTHVEYIAF